MLLEEKVQIDGASFYTGFTKEYIKVLMPAMDSKEDAGCENTIVRGIYRVQGDRLVFEPDHLRLA